MKYNKSLGIALLGLPVMLAEPFGVARADNLTAIYNNGLSADMALQKALEASEKEEQRQLRLQKSYLHQYEELKYYADQKAKKEAEALGRLVKTLYTLYDYNEALSIQESFDNAKSQADINQKNGGLSEEEAMEKALEESNNKTEYIRNARINYFENKSQSAKSQQKKNDPIILSEKSLAKPKKLVKNTRTQIIDDFSSDSDSNYTRTQIIDDFSSDSDSN